MLTFHCQSYEIPTCFGCFLGEKVAGVRRDRSSGPWYDVFENEAQRYKYKTKLPKGVRGARVATGCGPASVPTLSQLPPPSPPPRHPLYRPSCSVLMASKAASKRLTKEYVAMQREPPPFVWAVPDEKNILTWNYIIRGPPDSPFAGGEYHGVLLFPPEYPFKPPGIKMLTPSGRFQPDRKICFSMSDFHPGSWNPAWSVATILTGLLSFMLSDEMTTGSVTTSDAEKRVYAARSHAWNLGQRRFKEAFPDYCTPAPRDVPNMAQKELGSSSKPQSQQPPPQSQSQPQVQRVPSVPAPARITSTTSSPAHDSVLRTSSNNNNGSITSGSSGAVTPTGDSARAAATSWTAAIRQMVWEKWRWGVVLALAVIVSRMSSA